MRGLWVSWLFASVLAGCGSDDAGGGFESATSMVLYGAAAETELTPFPSNRYVVEDSSTESGVRVDIGAHNTADQVVLAYPGSVAQLNELDGFSTTGGVFVKLSAPIDARGIDQFPAAEPPILDPIRDADQFKTADSPLLLVNVDPDSPERGQAMGIVPRYFEQAKDESFLTDEFTVIAHPAVPLRPGTRSASVTANA